MASDSFTEDWAVDAATFDDQVVAVTSFDLLLVEHYVNDPVDLFEIPDDVRYFLDYVL